MQQITSAMTVRVNKSRIHYIEVSGRYVRGIGELGGINFCFPSERQRNGSD